jgi:glutamyl-tRNA reductase
MNHQPQVPLTTTIRAVRRRAERVRRQELARRIGQLKGLDPHQQATVEELTRRLVERLLHHPITRCAQLAAGPEGHRYVDLLHALYGPEPEPGSSDHEPGRSALPPTTETPTCRAS